MTITDERPASEAARRAMIDSQLRTSGINEPWVLEAMSSVPREDFVPESARAAAYIDRAVPLGNGHFLPAPLVHGWLLTEARPGKDDKALLIGASGYLAALVSPFVGSLEVRDLGEAGPEAKYKKNGYSLILVEGAVEQLPAALVAALADGGRIVAGLVERGVTRLATGRKAAGTIAWLPLAEIGIPVLPGIRSAEALELLSMPGGKTSTGARRLALGMLAGGASLSLMLSPALADDLRGALVSTYNTNPTLEAARANLRATDESVPIAKAAGRPAASATGSYTEIVVPTGGSALGGGAGPTLEGPTRQLNTGVNLSVPLYSGGAVKNQVRVAKLRVEAAQAELRATVSAIFSQAVAAYMDVILNEAVVGLNRNNVEVLAVNRQATGDRFEIGDLTRTDVAQSEARLAVARSDARTAEANLAAARERYILIVGNPPGELEPPPPLPGLPDAAEQAVAIALDNNPDIIAALERARAAAVDVRVAEAARLPKLNAVVGGTYSNSLGSLRIAGSGVSLPQTSSGLTVGLSGSIPLYQGGRPAAQRRQAQALESAALEQVIAAERDVIAQTRSAYQSWRAANDVITSSQAGVEAAALSLEGVRAENSVGNRTILDILNAEQELLNAQVRLVTARRNAYVAGFTLLAAMGRAEARDLGLDGGALYEPELNYNRVQGKWFDWENDPAPVVRSTRTVDTPVQDGAVSASDVVPLRDIRGDMR